MKNSSIIFYRTHASIQWTWGGIHPHAHGRKTHHYVDLKWSKGDNKKRQVLRAWLKTKTAYLVCMSCAETTSTWCWENLLFTLVDGDDGSRVNGWQWASPSIDEEGASWQYVLRKHCGETLPARATIMVICKNESAYCMMDSAREWRNTIVFYLLV